MYHSEAMLMSDGNVLLAGSNPNTKSTNDGPFPTIYQTQQFYPAYATWGVKRNVLANVSIRTMLLLFLLMHVLAGSTKVY